MKLNEKKEEKCHRIREKHFCQIKTQYRNLHHLKTAESLSMSAASHNTITRRLIAQLLWASVAERNRTIASVACFADSCSPYKQRHNPFLKHKANYNDQYVQRTMYCISSVQVIALNDL